MLKHPHSRNRLCSMLVTWPKSRWSCGTDRGVCLSLDQSQDETVEPTAHTHGTDRAVCLSLDQKQDETVEPTAFALTEPTLQYAHHMIELRTKPQNQSRTQLVLMPRKTHSPLKPRNRLCIHQ